MRVSSGLARPAATITFFCRSNSAAQIVTLWREGRFALLTSQEQLDELARVTRYPKIRERLSPALAEFFKSAGTVAANPADGAALLFQGDSPKVAEDFARNDPYVINGVVKSWRVREWTTVVGDGAAVKIDLSSL